MRYRYRSRGSAEEPELNITAFMNLMVILVPFLLITVVFSRISILEVNLPDPGLGVNDATSVFDLEITIRTDALVIGDRNSGPLKELPRREADYDLVGLSFFLQRIKAQFPDKLEATLLIEPDVSYDTLVQVMDAVREVELNVEGKQQRFQLFPLIAIGDAALTSANRFAATVSARPLL